MASFLFSLPALLVLPAFAYAQFATVTSYGPGQFCQGYSPGGGDTCMTIPAGCYVVPSGYNVVPELHCSSTTSASSASSATLSSTLVTTTRPASTTATPATSSYGSSTYIPSTSTPSTPVSSTTQASSTPTASSATSSALSPTTTPSTITTGPTSPTSTIPITSASSSAGGAAVLAGLVGAASDASSKANDAAKTFGSDPSPDNQQALKDAVSDAQSQTSKAKDAADATDLTDLVSKLDETLTQLTEAATELAKAEALADMAAAVAPEVAAALAAAAAAKEISDENDPTKPTKKPTDSAQSASATMTSGNPSSSVTSSATLSSSSGCPACVQCADSTIAPGPSPTPDDPFPQWTLTGGDDDGGNASTRKTRKRFPQHLQRRATDRDIEICQATVQVPPYNSWNGAGVGNSYSTYYSYKYSNAKPGSCVKYDFDIVTSATQPDTKDYATEHVYEIQLINIFLGWMATHNAELKDFLDKKNNKTPPPKNPANICNSLFNQLLFGQGSPWTTTKFGANGAIGTVGSRPIDELVSQLSGNARPSEMVYLEDGLNGMKAQLFGDKTPSSFTLLVEKLAILARSAMVYGYLESEEISTIFQAVSTRMKTFYAKLDTACAGKTTGPCAAKIQWADSYQTWQAEYLDQIDANWKTWKNGQLDQATAMLRTQYTGQAWAQTLLANVEANIDLQDAYYHIAGDLKI